MRITRQDLIAPRLLRQKHSVDRPTRQVDSGDLQRLAVPIVNQHQEFTAGQAEIERNFKPFSGRIALDVDTEDCVTSQHAFGNGILRHLPDRDAHRTGEQRITGFQPQRRNRQMRRAKIQRQSGLTVIGALHKFGRDFLCRSRFASRGRQADTGKWNGFSAPVIHCHPQERPHAGRQSNTQLAGTGRLAKDRLTGHEWLPALPVN